MSKILEFPRKVVHSSTDFPHATGEALCICCKHTWAAVAPVGTQWLQCPKCETTKGVFKHAFQFPEGQLVRECACGNQLFYLTPEGHMCALCGIYQMY